MKYYPKLAPEVSQSSSRVYFSQDEGASFTKRTLLIFSSRLSLSVSPNSPLFYTISSYRVSSYFLTQFSSTQFGSRMSRQSFLRPCAFWYSRQTYALLLRPTTSPAAPTPRRGRGRKGEKGARSVSTWSHSRFTPQRSAAPPSLKLQQAGQILRQCDSRIARVRFTSYFNPHYFPKWDFLPIVYRFLNCARSEFWETVLKKCIFHGKAKTDVRSFRSAREQFTVCDFHQNLRVNRQFIGLYEILL